MSHQVQDILSLSPLLHSLFFFFLTATVFRTSLFPLELPEQTLPMVFSIFDLATVTRVIFLK